MKRPDGESQILALDPATFEYRPSSHVQLPELEEAPPSPDVGDRIRALFLGDHRTGAFLRETLGPALVYAARVAPRSRARSTTSTA